MILEEIEQDEIAAHSLDEVTSKKIRSHWSCNPLWIKVVDSESHGSFRRASCQPIPRRCAEASHRSYIAWLMVHRPLH